MHFGQGMLAVKISRSDRLLQSCIGFGGHCYRNAVRSEVQGGRVNRPEADQHRKALSGDFCLVARLPARVFSNFLGGCQVFGAAEQKWVDWSPEPYAFGAAKHKYRETREREKLPDAGRRLYPNPILEDVLLSSLLRKMARLKIGGNAVEIHLP